jgi:DNA-binding CsgD family transcriptional regulator
VEVAEVLVDLLHLEQGWPCRHRHGLPFGQSRDGSICRNPTTIGRDLEGPGRPARRWSADRARRRAAVTTAGAAPSSGGWPGRSGRAVVAERVVQPDEVTPGAVDASGGALLPPRVTRRVVAAFAAAPSQPPTAANLDLLTDWEREVMALVAAGLSNQEIAERLVVSPATARTHVSRAMVKLNARDRARLVVLAYESFLVRPRWLGAVPWASAGQIGPEKVSHRSISPVR